MIQKKLAGNFRARGRPRLPADGPRRDWHRSNVHLTALSVPGHARHEGWLPRTASFQRRRPWLVQCPPMVEPRVIPRAEHTISRRDIDPDALKVLYRLHHFNHTAYLVGGSVRDLLIGRRPKDFDIGTSAHPYQVKKLFKNCWIIGRRFRLAHVKFGTKVIEVATFRRQVAPGEEVIQDGVPAAIPHSSELPEGASADGSSPATAEPDPYIHRDNTFGTPEEDAFRRDFTINALFYDIATFSVIDYVGGLDDLDRHIVRAIGDPEVRFREDPVRMMRAVALASRLDFAIDAPSLEAIQIHRHDIARSSPPRLLEEYYKILRAGASQRTFRALSRLGLLEPISAELHEGAELLWQSLAALDAYRVAFESTPDSLTNAILLGTLLVPMGLMQQRSGPDRSLAPRLGQLPLARRDIDRLRQILGLQRRLRDLTASPRAQRALMHRSVFREALTWLDIHGDAPDIVAHWKELGSSRDVTGDFADEATATEPRMPRRRRRRRRHRVHSTTGH
jgi:poly(A) polymerase